MPKPFKTLFLSLILLPLLVLAQIPQYYAPVNFNLTGEELKVQLMQLITETHTFEIPYTANTYPDVWDTLKLSDLDPENTENVLLIYGWSDTDDIPNTDRTRDKDLSCHTSSCAGLWLREHVFPRSLGNPNLGFSGAGTDVHNLRASDASRNSSRSNRIFESGSGEASYITTTGNWYPGEEWIGDVARIIMYMYLRYPTQCNPLVVGAGTNSIAPLNDIPDIFLQWNAIDPVSQYEINRNNTFQNIQGNRNPFIDNPHIATRIWNGPEAPDTWGVLSNTSTTLETITMYPTITYDIVNITNTINTPLFYSIHTLTGQTISSGTTTTQINLSTATPGMYLIKINTPSQHQTFKIIKQ